MKKLKAAIIGLGQVGQMFDLDKLRTGVWTHFSAYQHLQDKFDLVAVCEPDASKLKIALDRKPSLRGYSSVKEMLDKEELDVVSICTPPSMHTDQINACTGKIKAIICEKPLGLDVEKCKDSVNLCLKAKTLLCVNYYKRFDGCIPQVKKMLDGGRIGEISSINACFSGPLDAVGSHAVNIIEHLAGEIQLIRADKIEDERYSVFFKFGRNGAAQMLTTGPREKLIFEIDIVGTLGRITIVDNCSSFILYMFKPSGRYSGYEELVKVDTPQDPCLERFVPMFEEVSDCLHDGKCEMTLSGESALKTQLLLHKIKGCDKNG